MEQQQDNDSLTAWLQERGHTTEEIAKIMHRVARYEREMQLDSVMDSIGSGRLSLDNIIREALGD